MKKTEIALLILVVAIVGAVVYFIMDPLLGSDKNLSAEVTVVEPITSNVEQPDKKVFNSAAINPGIPVPIGNSSNQQPF